jgi:hypothetical protein
MFQIQWKPPIMAPPTPPDNPKTLISYAREDAEFAQKLAADLRSAGAAIWIDKDIAGGSRWDRVVQDAVDECPRMLVILSPASISSENVMDEVSYSLRKGKVVIPALYRDCEIPFRLDRFQRVNVRDGIQELRRLLGVSKMSPQLRPKSRRNRHTSLLVFRKAPYSTVT